MTEPRTTWGLTPAPVIRPHRERLVDECARLRSYDPLYAYCRSARA
jgi:hypothetical protein